jgi:hypothetical protein
MHSCKNANRATANNSVYQRQHGFGATVSTQVLHTGVTQATLTGTFSISIRLPQATINFLLVTKKTGYGRSYSYDS